MGPKHAKLQIFIQQVFSFYKRFTVKIKTKTCQQQPDLVCGRFRKVFYKRITCPRRLLLSGPKSDRLIQVWLCIIWSKETHVWLVAGSCNFDYSLNFYGNKNILLHIYKHISICFTTCFRDLEDNLVRSWSAFTSLKLIIQLIDQDVKYV